MKIMKITRGRKNRNEGIEKRARDNIRARILKMENHVLDKNCCLDQPLYG